jgi:hypothetical protein
LNKIEEWALKSLVAIILLSQVCTSSQQISQSSEFAHFETEALLEQQATLAPN